MANENGVGGAPLTDILAEGFTPLVRSLDALRESNEAFRQTILGQLGMQQAFARDPGIRNGAAIGINLAGAGAVSRRDADAAAAANYLATNDITTQGERSEDLYPPGYGMPTTTPEASPDPETTPPQTTTGPTPHAAPYRLSGDLGKAIKAVSARNMPPVIDPDDPYQPRHQAGPPPAGGGGAGGGGGGGGGGQAPSPSGGGGGGGTTPTQPGLFENSLQAARNGILPVGAAFNILDEIRSQRDKNAQYQAIEGTDNLTGFHERYNEALYSMTTRGMFSPEESSALFKNVTALGLTERSDNAGLTRKEALDFAYDSKKMMGMDVQESSNILVEATKYATTSLGELSNELQQVSKAAGEAGVNSKVARENFMRLYSTAQENGMPGSLGTTGMIAEYQTKMGRGYQNVDMSGLYSSGYQAMMSAATGMDMNAIKATAITNPTGYAQMVGQQQDVALSSLVTPDMETWLANEVQEAGGYDLLARSEDFLAQSYARWLQYLSETGAPPVEVFAQAVGALTGQANMNPTEAYLFLLGQYGGKSMEDVAKEQEEKVAVKEGSTDANMFAGQSVTEHGVNTAAEWGFKAARMEGPLGMNMNAIPGFAPAAAAIGGGFGLMSGLFGTEGPAAATDAYMSWSDTEGKSDPVMEQILNGLKEQGIDDEQRVRVQTAEGEKVVNIEEAVKYYRNQLTTGVARFAGGELDGEKAAAIPGVEGLRTDTESMSAAKQEALNAPSDVGMSAEDYDKEQRENGEANAGSAGGPVTIDFTPDAKRWLRQIPNPDAQGTTLNPSDVANQ